MPRLEPPPEPRDAPVSPRYPPGISPVSPPHARAVQAVELRAARQVGVDLLPKQPRGFLGLQVRVDLVQVAPAPLGLELAGERVRPVRPGAPPVPRRHGGRTPRRSALRTRGGSGTRPHRRPPRPQIESAGYGHAHPRKATPGSGRPRPQPGVPGPGTVPAPPSPAATVPALPPCPPVSPALPRSPLPRAGQGSACPAVSRRRSCFLRDQL